MLIGKVEMVMQVEHVRLSIPKEQPLAVQQWDGLIAVNYAARAAGIARHERAGEALRKVGILEFVCHHAATRDEKQLSGFVFIRGLWCNCLLPEIVVFAGFSVHVAIMFC
jgi:nucleotidyltransferase/DNA polymerase involved in DNA repair